MSKTPNYSDMSGKTHVALIHETWRESAARDLTTVAVFVMLWLLGHFANSAALEWVGVLFGLVFLFIRVLNFFKGTMDKRMTPDEARAWLDEKFPTPTHNEE